MNQKPENDGRSPRCSDGVTLASSHPELVSGDFAIPPRSDGPTTSMHRSSVSGRSRKTLGMLGIVAVATLPLMTILHNDSPSGGSDVEKPRLARTCMQWHAAAAASVSRLVQSTHDADLVKVGDAVFRLRRARRNCEAGWIVLACQDYHVVANGTPGYALAGQLFPCARLAGAPQSQD